MNHSWTNQHVSEKGTDAIHDRLRKGRVLTPHTYRLRNFDLMFSFTSGHGNRHNRRVIIARISKQCHFSTPVIIAEVWVCQMIPNHGNCVRSLTQLEISGAGLIKSSSGSAKLPPREGTKKHFSDSLLI